MTLPLVFDGTRLYLERYWRFEEQVADDLLRRVGAEGGLATGSPGLADLLDNVFQDADQVQKRAGAWALGHRLTVIGGGPGTGKTRTISRLLAAAYSVALGQARQLEVALAAPTGKAATRMEAAVHEAAAAPELDPDAGKAMALVKATTLHRLLGITVGGPPRRNSRNKLPHDLVVVDESSMVSCLSWLDSSRRCATRRLSSLSAIPSSSQASRRVQFSATSSARLIVGGEMLASPAPSSCSRRTIASTSLPT